MKGLNYYKNNAEEDYLGVPISVLRYIDKLEKQQERSYSEEEVEILLETLSKVLVYQGNEYILPFYFQNEIKQVIEQFKKK